MDSPPNLRMMGTDNKACGNCRHYKLPGRYNPAESREGRGRRLMCTKYMAEVQAYDVCDAHVSK